MLGMHSTRVNGKMFPPNSSACHKLGDGHGFFLGVHLLSQPACLSARRCLAVGIFSEQHPSDTATPDLSNWSSRQTLLVDLPRSKLPRNPTRAMLKIVLPGNEHFLELLAITGKSGTSEPC